MGKNLPIQYLRAFAALLVVAFHAPATIAAFGNSLPLLRAGAYGVDIFFVISGFIMGATGASGGSSRAERGGLVRSDRSCEFLSGILGNQAADFIAGSVAKYASSGV
ncbi:acyltransferase-like protein [Paraburkholderia sp. RAU2J]|uniref:acyltransferase family protein n=1 Tax=Paraburkholderia sp. RAU2J TaxID=1938810 RepID=UPI000F210D06|nr:acyltransferase family protein [Paraburkholderia sp. RAU2J]RKT10518.1 acyltransferase-like protein [Paraburkholderia sp. RAU2J]